MNEKEKKDFYVAMCRCCLIADSMKGCAICLFNIGLAAPAHLLEGTRQIPQQMNDEYALQGIQRQGQPLEIVNAL